MSTPLANVTAIATETTVIREILRRDCKAVFAEPNTRFVVSQAHLVNGWSVH